VGIKVHHFVVDDAPTIHEGIRVRVVGLLPMTDKATVCKIADMKSFAKTPSIYKPRDP